MVPPADGPGLSRSSPRLVADVTPVTVLFTEFTARVGRCRRDHGRMRPMRRTARDSPVARQILLLQVLVVLLLVAAALGLAAYDARQDNRDHARDQAVSVAESVADSPSVREAMRSEEPCPTLQPYAEQVRVDTGVDFVVVMELDRTRCTHPDPEQIGKEFIGDLGDAPEGEVFTQEFAGTLGPSIRAVVPVRDGDQVVALVSVGITLDRIGDQLREDL